jgi:hypothetical protein
LTKTGFVMKKRSYPFIYSSRRRVAVYFSFFSARGLFYGGLYVFIGSEQVGGYFLFFFWLGY